MATHATKTGGTRSVHRLKVTLMGTRPPVWRRVAVPSSTTLADLHHILQVTMGWQDCHLHQFQVGQDGYGPRDGVDDGWGPRTKNEAGAKLYGVAPAGSRFAYEYDFGDGWRHEVVVEKVEKVAIGDPGADGPACLAGRRACPPEDCGGVWGYQHLLEVLADTGHEEYGEMLECVGEAHDARRFDVDEVNARLAWARGPLVAASRR